ncbi:secretory carrier-associated membrane protein 1-like [Clavelina lepadiformis]|uniref:Secretory carrier-associated membrane protein n=1 Tax=Clavelina lepadiformis TaxID=159417 RepID=A0ABP0FH36_CLALP
MSDSQGSPFADPFKNTTVTATTSSNQNPNLNDFNPFADDGRASTTQPAILQPKNPPGYNQYGTNSSLSAPPVRAAAPAPILPGHEELLKRQEELERKDEALRRKEQQLTSDYDPRQKNWPPLPKCCPVGPCFYQDFSVDIPSEFQRTVKMLYYLWIYYAIINFVNILAAMAIFIEDSNAGTTFGLSILWFLICDPCSLCWYRPVYNAFRSDSSFNFFIFFFIMFFQFCFAVLMAIGIPGAGWVGWIVAASHYNKSTALSVFSSIQAILYTIMAVLSLVLLKRVHSIYRSTGASFDQAQRQFATNVMKNPGVQTAATTAATSAMQSNMGGK